jgi:hypothetical protein
MRFIGALVLTYFFSRAMRRLGLKHPPLGKLIAAHLLSLILCALLAFAVRYPASMFLPGQLTVYVVAQLAWLALDMLRSRAAFWKPPVAKPTEPSPTARAARNP